LEEFTLPGKSEQPTPDIKWNEPGKSLFCLQLEKFAKQLLKAVRGHWGIKQDSSKKIGIKNKRLVAAWNNDYLAHLFCG
jgi:hypothetical protein